MDIGGIESAFSRQRCLHCDTRAPVWGIGREGEKITVTSLMVANYGSSNRICQATSGACGTGYIGIFDDVAQGARRSTKRPCGRSSANIDELRQVRCRCRCRSAWPFSRGVDRTVGGYEGLMAAQQRLPNNEVRDKFAAQLHRARHTSGRRCHPIRASAHTRKITAG
jgi:hypothetical protein